MPALALLTAIAVVAFQQLVEWRFGTIGLKAKNHTCSSIGAVVLALMFAGPAL